MVVTTTADMHKSRLVAWINEGSQPQLESKKGAIHFEAWRKTQVWALHNWALLKRQNIQRIILRIDAKCNERG